MTSRINKEGSSVVNVYLKKNNVSNNIKNTDPFSEENDIFTDPGIIEEKYGSRINVTDMKICNENIVRHDIKQGSELIDRTEILIKRLAKKDQEIEKLCILLECCETVPGLHVAICCSVNCLHFCYEHFPLFLPPPSLHTYLLSLLIFSLLYYVQEFLLKT